MLCSARKLLSTAIVLAVASWSMPPAQAWGPHGHRIAARVAEARLTPEATAAVRELLNPGDTLADVADWADHDGHTEVPGSAPWHYVNVPLAAPRYDEKYCSNRGCVVAKIRHFRKVLADRQGPRKERRRALLFLVHFVEDVHQPLHVGDNRDQGGNLTQVRFRGRGTNLHRIWDSDLIDHAGLGDRAWMERINAEITPERAAGWSKGDVEDWATESLEAARRAYHLPGGPDTPLQSGAELGDAYAKAALPIVQDRLARAGVRLANELNSIFR